MTIFQTLGLAFQGLMLHRFRSLLASLGIIFGVASVEAMMAISQGAQEKTLQQIISLGIDNLVVRSRRPAPTSKDTTQKQGWVLAYGLFRGDLTHFRAAYPEVKEAIGGRNLRLKLFNAAARQVDVQVLATEPAYLEMTRSKLVRGRFLSALDELRQQRVCVLGSQAARQLLGFADPLQASVSLGGKVYRVVGIIENPARLKDAGGEDINRQVYVPMATAREDFSDQSFSGGTGSFEATRVELDLILLRLHSSDLALSTARRMENYLGRQHPQRDYEIIVPYELLQRKAATQKTFSMVMASIASLSLLIGGIGIMNIMVANVSERRKEIGTRRALGASRQHILWQFLLEASLLSGIGGLLGLAVGYVLACLIASMAHWPVVLAAGNILLALGISSCVGVVFGFWPARQAAQVSPIEALRAG